MTGNASAYNTDFKGRRRGRRTKKKVTKREKAIAPIVKKIVKRTMHSESEYKFCNYQQNSSDQINQTGNIYNITATLTQGLADTAHIGDRATPMGVHGIVTVGLGAGATTNEQICRLILFQWHMDNNVEVPTLSDILYNSAAGVAPISNYAVDLNRKFTILSDRVFKLPVIANFCAGGNDGLLKYSIKRKLPAIEFEGAGASGINHLYLLVVGTAAVGTAAATHNSFLRTWFLDS